MIFSKTDRLNKDKFHFVIGGGGGGGRELESDGQYKYLGVTFSKNAKFSLEPESM